MQSQYHLAPIDDLRPHDLSGDCWCHPEQDEESGVWIHNSMDRREEYEEGRLVS